jgi:hypothetical protein
MPQNLMLSTSDLVSLKRREDAGCAQYSPIFIGDHAVAMAKFMAENEIPTAQLEMALAEKADDASLPFFYVRHNENFTRFHVTPGNVLAGAYLSRTKILSEDGLVGLFQYCSNK